jgi:hypothetical protein
MLLQRQHLRIVNHQDVDRIITTTATTTTTTTGTTGTGTSSCRNQQRGQACGRRNFLIPAHLESIPS